MTFLNQEAIIIKEVSDLLTKAGMDTSRLNKLLATTTSVDKLSASEVLEVENNIKK